MSHLNPYQSPAQIPLEPAVDVQQEPSFGRVTSKLFEVFAAQWPTVLAALFFVCLPWELLYSYVEHFVATEEDSSLLFWLLLSGPLTFLLFAEAVVIAATRQHLLREKGGLAGAFLRGIVSFPRLFLWRLASGLVIGIGLLICALPGIYLNIRWMYVSAAIINEQGSSESPLRSSWRLTEAGFGYSTLVFFGLALPMLVAIMGPSLLQVVFEEQLNHWPITVGVGLVGDLAVLMVSIGFACAYHDLGRQVR